MRKLNLLLFAIVAVLMTAMTAFAQAPAADHAADSAAGLKAIAAAVGFAIAVFGGALGQSRIGARGGRVAGNGEERIRHRHRDLGSAAASRGDAQHSRQLVPTQREVEGRPRSHGRGRSVNRVGNFRFPYLGKFGFPLTG